MYPGDSNRAGDRILKNCEHCLHETCKDGKNCKGNHTLNGHTEKCVDPYTICCLCDEKTFFPKESVILK